VDATVDATAAATAAATRAVTAAATAAATMDGTDKWYGLGGCSVSDMARVAQAFGDPTLLISWAASANNMLNGGNQWSGWVVFLSFFRHVAKLKLDYSKWQHYENAAVHSGPRYMHAKFCIVSDRPEHLMVDAQNRPHAEDGPFCRWRDGSRLYSVHGVRVPGWIVDHPERITVETIDAERNAEVRRVMIQKYGLARFVKDSGAVEVHRDEFGMLRRRKMPHEAEPLMTIEVVNSTPEPDGTFKVYTLRVHPELKPLPPGHLSANAKRQWLDKAKPQALTAKAAVASTFGMTAAEYNPWVQT
jgi:hypothetical protein